MVLWTIQDYSAYQQFQRNGVLVADKDYIDMLSDFQFAYNWMVWQMKQRIGYPPVGVEYPIWAWYQWRDEEHKMPDMRFKAHTKTGQKIVRITFEADEKDVLLSDFEMFHITLNYGFISFDEREDEELKKEYTNLGFTCMDLRDFLIQTPEMKILREKIEKSWEAIFNFTSEPSEWLIHTLKEKSIQATLWTIRSEQVLKVEEFIAK